LVLRRLRRWLLLRDPEVKFIVEKGVDHIPDPESLLPRDMPLMGRLREGIEETSRFLDSEEAVSFFISASEEKVDYNVKFYGFKGQTLLLLTGAPKPLEGPWLLVASGEDWLARLLVFNNMVTGAQVSTREGEFYGKSAIEFLESAYGEVVVHAVRLKVKPFAWRPERFSVFVKGIDRQHQYLVSVLNMAYLSLVTGQPRKVQEDIVGRLVDYSRFHFKSEEILFDKLGYPEDRAEIHRREHRAFARKAIEFYEKLRAGEAALTLDVLKFLSSWLEGHIGGSDRAFGLWLKRVGAPITD
jgi:hemerythrin